MTLAPSTSRRPVTAALPVADAVARAAIVPLTVEQYHRMIEQGIVPEDNTVELLRGVLVRKDRSSPGEDPMGHGPLHRMVVALLTALAARINSESCHLQIQLPVACPPDGEPEPDGSIVRGTPRDYAGRIPSAADASCVIEAAHSSLPRDREDKLPVYAAAGVPQYLIINLHNNTIEVYTDPDPAAEDFRTRGTVERHGEVVLRLPHTTLRVAAADLLP